MALKLFDRKFGAEFVAALPSVPGVYVFRDGDGAALYVGKAVDLRRRLLTYRSAGRRKVHRKMRELVRQAAALEVQPLASERAALLRENELIRQLRPPFNIEGAFSFLYPAIGIGTADDRDLLCFTTRPAAYDQFGFCWHGAFRSRPRARQAFDALVELLSMLGHIEPVSRLPPHPVLRGSRLVAFRQLPRPVREQVTHLLGGTAPAPLAGLAEFLLEKPRARRDAELVEEHLRCLAAFWETDLHKLRCALDAAGIAGRYIDQQERDALFISTAAQRDGAGRGVRRGAAVRATGRG